MYDLVDVHRAVYAWCIIAQINVYPLQCNGATSDAQRVGTKLCNHNSHEGDTVGFDEDCKSKSKSTQSTLVVCGRFAFAMVEAHNVSVKEPMSASGTPATADLWPVGSRVEVY